MPRHVDFEGTLHEFPDDFTDAEISKALASYKPAAATAAMPTPGATAASMAQTRGGQARNMMRDTLLGLLPAAGGMIGSRIGPEGAFLGGMVGQLGAEGGRMAMGAAPPAPPPAGAPMYMPMPGGSPGPMLPMSPEATGMWSRVGGAGLAQLGGDYVGRGAAGAMKFGARQLMQTALKPGKPATRQATDLIGDALEQGATVGSAFGRGGLRAAEKVRGARGAAATAAYDQATKTGVTVSPTKLLPRLDDLVPLGTPMRSEALKRAQLMLRQFMGSNRKPMTPTELKAMKRQSWEEAHPIFAQIAEGKVPVTTEQRMWANFHHKLGQNINDALEAIPTIGKDIRAAETATKKAIGVTRAVKNAEETAASGMSAWVAQGFGRGAFPAGGAFLGTLAGDPDDRFQNAIVGGAAGAFGGSPAVMSRLAHMPNNPFLQWLARNAPRFGAAAVPLYYGSPADTTYGR